MSEETEQNKTEEPTPFKLKKAREKGNIAKGMDLAFFGTLVGLTLFLVIAAQSTGRAFMEVMRFTLSKGIADATTPDKAPLAIGYTYFSALYPVLLLGGTVFVCVFLVQMIQTRGLLFTTHPLKPDFSRINPAKGLKKIFSMRTLKEAVKNIFKMSVYIGCTYLLVMYCLKRFSPNITDVNFLHDAMRTSALWLLFMYMALALVFAAIDQVIVRREYLKQMRMSKSELKREIKDREGEPRIKAKRKQLHEEFAKQTSSLGELPGSDVLIVNPQHFAVGLAYDANEMTAPRVTAKGRNRFALLLKQRAFNLQIPIIENPPLARSLFRTTPSGSEIPSKEFRAVADIYLRLHQNRITGQTS